MANKEMTAEEMEKQRQQQAQMQAMYLKQMKWNVITSVVSSTDPSTILKTMSRYNGGITLCCRNPVVSVQLLNTIYNDLFKGALDDDILKSIGDSLNKAVSYTNQYRMNFGGMNPMMGMGMMGGMPGMNPMMGMGMPGMMPNMMGGMNGCGMPGMNPMMGMGMPGMMPNMMGGMNGCGMSQPEQNKNDKDNIAYIKQYIETNLKPNSYYYTADPLIFLQILINSGIDIDFSEDKSFSQLCSTAILDAICGMNDLMFNAAYCTIFSIYQSDYMQQWQDAQKKNGNNQNQNNMMGMGMFGMNPMMGMGMMGGMPGMNPMMGMGMMGGMPGMNPMMGMGMPGVDANAANGGMNMGVGMMPNMMGGMPGMNPMMGMGMPGMMPNMMGGMPGMNPMMNGVQNTGNAIW